MRRLASKNEMTTLMKLKKRMKRKKKRKRHHAVAIRNRVVKKLPPLSKRHPQHPRKRPRKRRPMRKKLQRKRKPKRKRLLRKLKKKRPRKRLPLHKRPPTALTTLLRPQLLNRPLKNLLRQSSNNNLPKKGPK